MVSLAGPSITVCVPVGPNHIDLVPRLLQNLSLSVPLPDRVLVAPSAPIDRPWNSDSCGLSVDTLDVEPGASAGRNRNRAWDLADTDFVTFCDVDDWYAPWRIRYLLEAMETHKAEMAYHSYKYLWPPLFIRAPRGKPLVAGPELLGNLNRNIKIDLEQTNSGGNNPKFPTLSGESRASLGHVTVLRDLNLRFPSIAHGEDGWLASEALRTNRRVIYVANVLSIYDPLSVKNLRMAATSRVKHHLRRTGTKLWRLGPSK